MVKPGAENQVVHTKANTNQHLFREDLPIQARLCSHCLHGMETRMFNFWRRVNTIAQFRFLSVLKSIRFLHFHRAALGKISTLKTPDDSLLCCLQFRKPFVDCFVAKLLTDLARSRRPLSCSSRQRSAQKFDQNCIYNKTQFIRYTTEETCAQKPTKLEFHSTQSWIWRRNCSF